ncbi:MAG: response regulator [Chloroflexi bacterium]|uniref:Response regulator n=1 Tax=Candidatus Chlorohelix allophototropha TaxID=3003348 RepID=A0A8T7M690_9CHLR|nr:response regulator [Chloroflexota bacterium]WJW69540.1 response regulator [Chloroflexota bacterium L227-S17]
MYPNEITPVFHSILLVEDSEEDYQTILWVFKKLEISYPVHRVLDGEEALDFLNHNGKYSVQPRLHLPSIILLDLNLPGTDGRDILYSLKHNEKFKLIPVIVLTTTNSPKDVETCYRSGANSYILKPVNLDRFLQMLKLMIDYWFETIILPGEDSI